MTQNKSIQHEDKNSTRKVTFYIIFIKNIYVKRNN